MSKSPFAHNAISDDEFEQRNHDSAHRALLRRAAAAGFQIEAVGGGKYNIVLVLGNGRGVRRMLTRATTRECFDYLGYGNRP